MPVEVLLRIKPCHGCTSFGNQRWGVRIIVCPPPLIEGSFSVEVLYNMIYLSGCDRFICYLPTHLTALHCVSNNHLSSGKDGPGSFFMNYTFSILCVTSALRRLSSYLYGSRSLEVPFSSDGYSTFSTVCYSGSFMGFSIDCTKNDSCLHMRIWVREQQSTCMFLNKFSWGLLCMFMDARILKLHQ